MTLKEVVDRLAPDLTATLKRFPFAIVLLAGTAILALIALKQYRAELGRARRLL